MQVSYDYELPRDNLDLLKEKRKEKGDSVKPPWTKGIKEYLVRTLACCHSK